ncbi:MAG: response regulator [Alphaproteobacteria bacterium]|nr:response regulator [Alphaproteobacteria bacterium]
MDKSGTPRFARLYWPDRESGKESRMWQYAPARDGGLLVTRDVPPPERSDDDRRRQGQGASSQPGRPRILVVEDDPDVMDYVVAVLLVSGYEVLEAADAETALATVRDCAGINLLLSDIGLPGEMDGIDLALAVKRAYPGLRVLFMSGNPHEAVSGRRIAREEVDLIVKPFMPHTLTERVAAILSAG